MHRTQIYLPEEDYRGLLRLGQARGRSLADLVRCAVQRYLEEESQAASLAVLEDTFGLWRDRETESLRDLRQGWSRREARLASPDR